METQMIDMAICDNPQLLLDDLGLDYDIKNDRVDGVCCVHDGDNSHAMRVYFNEYNGIHGRWACYSGNCHKVFYNSLTGWVRGILSNRHCRWSKRGDAMYSFGETLRYLKGLYGIGELPRYSAAELEKKDGPRKPTVLRKSIKSNRIYYILGRNSSSGNESPHTTSLRGVSAKLY